MENERQFNSRLNDAVEQVDSSMRSKALHDMNLILDFGVNTFTKLLATASNDVLPTEIRSIACWFLSRLGDDHAVPALLKCLNDRSSDLRCEATRAFGTMGIIGTVSILINTLKCDPSKDVRFHAIYALGLLADPKALEPIIETLIDTSEEPEVRGMAAETLSVFSSHRTVETLIDCLSDPMVEVRYWSAFALGQLGAKQAIAALRHLASTDGSLMSDGSSIKDEATDAIKKINAD